MVDAWLRHLSETEILAELNAEVIESAASGNMYETWRNVVRAVTKHYKHCDGFVIVHPQEHLLRGMHMIAFMLGQVGKPVVYTTTPLERDEKSTLAQNTAKTLDHYFFLGLEIHFLNALQYASFSVAGYTFVFGDTIFPALRTFAIPSDLNQKFDTLDKNYCGVVNMGVQLLVQPSLEDLEALPEVRPDIESHISIIDTLNLDVFIPTDVAGILVKADSGEQERKTIFRGLQQCVQQRIPTSVFLGNAPDVQDELKEIHNGYIIPLSGMIWETAISKWMWVLGQSKDPREIARLLWDNRAGEYKQ